MAAGFTRPSSTSTLAPSMAMSGALNTHAGAASAEGAGGGFGGAASDWSAPSSASRLMLPCASRRARNAAPDRLIFSTSTRRCRRSKRVFVI